MDFDDIPMDSIPSDGESKERNANDNDIACLWEGEAITFGVMVAELNAMLRGEIPLSIPDIQDIDEEGQKLLDTFDPSDLRMDYTWKSQYMEGEEYFRFLCKLGRLFAGVAGHLRKREHPISRAGQIAFNCGRSIDDFDSRRRILICIKVQKETGP